MQTVLVEFRLHRKVDSCWPPTALLGKARVGMLLVGSFPRQRFKILWIEVPERIREDSPQRRFMFFFGRTMMVTLSTGTGTERSHLLVSFCSI